MAVAVFKHGPVLGDVVATSVNNGIQLSVNFIKLPAGKGGFHIHDAGDLRGSGCKGACSHWSKTPSDHGDFGEGHTGDLGNISADSDGRFSKTYFLKGVTVDELWGRTIIVHEDEDDLGQGGHEDSKTTGHAGKRIACAIFGRMKGCEQKGGGSITQSNFMDLNSIVPTNTTITLGVLLSVGIAGLGFLLSKNKKTRKNTTN